MKRLIRAMLAAVGLCSGCSNTAVLSPRQFTNDYVEALRKASPGLTLAAVKDLEVKVTTANGQPFTVFLNNAYDAYKPNPESKAEIIRKYVAAVQETVAGNQSEAGLDPTRIVPVIKDRGWIEDTRRALMNRGATNVPESVYDELNSDLTILYAEDSPKNIKYFSPKELEQARIDRKDLRALACENLKRMLPQIERKGGNGLFILMAGGDYDASLLLIDSVWKDMQNDVRGDIVVAIPTRDLLIVTGSNDSQGIEKMKQIVQEASAQGSYRLTTNLFVYREGKFERFEN